jgi:hypothetical protein
MERDRFQEADPAERLALGQALLEIRDQRRYIELGFTRFEAFLDSEACPVGHTVARYAIKLAERQDLHAHLDLGIARITELMRLPQKAAQQLLREGTPNGPIAELSVRVLRRYVLGLLGEQPVTKMPLRPEQIDQLIDSWASPLREQLLNRLLKKQFGHDLSKLRGLLRKDQSHELAPFFPDTRRSVPQRWVALTAHLERLEQLLGGNPRAVSPFIRQLRLPLENWERSVFYLDLCRRDPIRQSAFHRHSSACTAIEQILRGKDGQFNIDQPFLQAQLAQGQSSKQPPRLKPFWRRLFEEVNPPSEYRSFLGQLDTEVVGGQWQIRCIDSYQAEYLRQCLRNRKTALFWQIAADVIGSTHICLQWAESGKPQTLAFSLQRQVA